MYMIVRIKILVLEVLFVIVNIIYNFFFTFSSFVIVYTYITFFKDVAIKIGPHAIVPLGKNLYIAINV